jgi:uncharacterized membrane protein YkvA (DUF1232 family)
MRGSNEVETSKQSSRVPTRVPIRVKDLRDYLERNNLSPESLASSAKLSHMTIRRWLQKKDLEELPAKYAPILNPLLNGTPMTEIPQFSITASLGNMNMSDLMLEIERNGMDYNKGVDALETDVGVKLKGARLDKLFADYCKRLIKMIRGPKVPFRAKAVCVGALLYFISPIDLIPDHIPVVGYLDDLAVLSIALNYANDATQSEEKKSQERLALANKVI